MSHPLEDVIRRSEGFVLIGDSSTGCFPATAFHAQTDEPAKRRELY
jgi:hypothetical protein